MLECIQPLHGVADSYIMWSPLLYLLTVSFATMLRYQTVIAGLVLSFVWITGASDLKVQAICRLAANPFYPLYPDISGVVVFTQRISCYGHYALQIKITISGMPADGNWTYHGLHIHQSGDMSNGCESMGPHFNPYRTVHGSQNDPPNRRHVGDLGNVVKDPYGNVQGAIFDNLASLVGNNSVVRRGVVLHEGQDDLGRGSNMESLRTGNAGRRLACCSIEPL